MNLSRRFFSTIDKPPKFLLKMEHAVSKEKTKENLTVKIAQQKKALPKGIGKKIKSADQLPEKSYINFKTIFASFFVNNFNKILTSWRQKTQFF